MTGAGGPMGAAGSPSDPTDAVLIGRVVAFDDRRAFAVLVGRHSGRLRAVLRRMTCGDDGLADDLAQSTWIKAYQSLAQFRCDARLRTWLYRIAFNEFLQHQRRTDVKLAARGTERGGAAVASGFADALPGEEDETFAADVAETSLPELALDLERALDALPEDERLAILACYHADFSHAEAALLLRCPVGSLKTRIARGRARLQVALALWQPHSLERLA